MKVQFMPGHILPFLLGIVGPICALAWLLSRGV